VKMATALKLISIFGRQRADRFLKRSLSQKGSESRFAWAVRESMRTISPTTFKEAEEEAFDVVPNVGVPAPATLKKALPERVRQYEKCGGARLVTKLTSGHILQALRKDLRQEDFKVHLISLGDFARPGLFRFFCVTRSEGGYLTKDGNYSYHVISFRIYGRQKDDSHYMLEGVGYRKDAF